MRKDIKKRIKDIEKGILPSGYRQKNKHICPDDWKLHKMQQITNRLSIKNDNETNYPVYSINNLVGFIPQNEQFEQGGYVDLDKSNYKIVSRGEFAYNPARINIGSIGLLKNVEKAIISSLYVCFSCEKDVDISYLEQWLKTFSFYKETIRNLEGSVREYLFYENFSKINIVLPKTTEQQKIAEILNHCDKVIELKQQLVEEELKRKKWLMENLLSADSGVRLSGFSGRWTKLKMKACLKVKHGRNQKQIECNSGVYPILASGGEIGRTNKPIYSMPSVLIGRKGTINKPVYIDTPFWTVDTLFYTDIKKTVYPKFIYYLFWTIQWYKFSECTGVPSLSASVIENIDITIPNTFKEQQAIANLLSATDKMIDLLKLELTQWQLKKKSLMQLLLTGIVRVNV